MRDDDHRRMDAASATECTGMQAALLRDEEQAQALEELYPLTRQKSLQAPPREGGEARRKGKEGT